ncbi:cytidine deoxycytidylate deaminase family protein [Xylaria nigripes]|nr:cytidine deoxycytidylate deaminase family protein [Xylaria nigripes]
MATIAYDTDAAALLNALLTTIEQELIPLTLTGAYSNGKLPGAAILSKSNLVPLTVARNSEAASPLLHGEINCIRKFLTQMSFPDTTVTGETSSSVRPHPRDCVFLVTHEPCSLCLTGITWSGFDNFFYMFTYEDNRDPSAIPYDTEILQEVFGVPPVLPPSGSKQPADEDRDTRPLYNCRNKFFTARSLGDLVREITEKHGAAEGKKWEDEVSRVKALYNGLGDTTRNDNTAGYVYGGSFWK